VERISLKRKFYDRRVNTFDVVAGDYPFDKKAQMRIAKNAPPSNTAQQYAEHLYSWLRNGRLTRTSMQL